ncbi:hypothetical protein LCGC14_1668310 [marine sediment metagenome]|uniref:Uncharacterized protein n=1 Tax=marine sediment metagenome TaxID=412755 RepID=A0A0F9K7X4_9ZZZZ
MNKEKGTVRYVGHNSATNENLFAVPSGFTDLPPVPYARLIAAAPYLLAALERLTIAAASFHADVRIKIALKEARNIIAKAGVREPQEDDSAYIADNASRPKRCPDCGGPLIFSEGYAECPVCAFSAKEGV